MANLTVGKYPVVCSLQLETGKDEVSNFVIRLWSYACLHKGVHLTLLLSRHA